MRSRSDKALTSWRLVSGRNETRMRLNIGQLHEDEAKLCAEVMNREEKLPQPHYDRVIRLELKPEALAELLLDIDNAQFPPIIDYGGLTVEEYFDEVYWPVRSDPTTEIGVVASTSENELGYWRNKRQQRGILQSEIGRTRLRDLTDQHWERWQAAQTQLSGRAKVLRRNAYASLLGYARRMGHIRYQPEFFRIKGATQTTRPRAAPLSLEEVKALLRVADPMRRALWGVGIGLGLRPGELVRVCWEDVHWEDRTIAVRGTKTIESADTIPTTPLAYRALQTLWVEAGQPEKGRAFLYRGKPFVQYKKALDNDARAAGIERHVAPYLLRHSFVTIAWALGIDRDIARRIMRHTDFKMIDRIYCRPRPADLVERASAFDFEADHPAEEEADRSQAQASP